MRWTIVSEEKRMTRVLLLLAAAFVAVNTHAQQWPAKPVRVIVNVAPGGVADVTARVLGARLSETLGQPFVIENRPGGDGYIGFEAVTRSDPDGYTVAYSPGSSMMIAPHIVKRADLDPMKLLTPVVATGGVSLYVLLHPGVPANNYEEFLAYARANPGKLNYGTPGNGTSPHIATEVFNREAKVKLNHVPYKGAGPALNDLLGGQIQLAFDPGVGLNAARSGTLRMVAVAGPLRHPEFPDAPPGSDWAPLWEALAKPYAEGEVPEYISSRHEETAIGMATGYAKATGKLPALVLHTTVGALHATMGMRAALHERIPMVVMAGESISFAEAPAPPAGRQWLRVLTDLGGPARLVEPSVKWSFGLNSSLILPHTIQRACQLAMSAPRGPVFVSVPTEMLMETMSAEPPPVAAIPAAPAGNERAIAEVAAALN